MPRKSSVQRQAPEVRDEINDRMDGGQTLDEIMVWLRENGVTEISRTALWRWGKQLDRIMAKARRSRMLAEVMVRSVKKTSENRLVQANIQSMHGVLMQLVDAAENEESVTIDSKDALNLSRSIAALALAEKSNAQKMIMVEEHIKEEPAQAEGGTGGVIEIAFVEPKPEKAKKPRKAKAKKAAKTERE